MSTTWTYTGLDVAELFGEIEAALPLYIDEAAGEIMALGHELAARMHELILAAHTPTGEKRVALWPGLHAGRYDSGRMYDAVDYDVKLDEAGITLSWGWIDDLQTYFLYQEYGTEQIAAVGSLADTFTLGLTRMAQIMDRLTEGR